MANSDEPHRIVVVDDEERLREATLEILADAGYDAMAVSDGAELIRAYRALRRAGVRQNCLEQF